MANFIDTIKNKDTGESYSIIPAIEMYVNETDYKLTVKIKNPSTNAVLKEAEIDLPIENMVTNAEYDSDNKQLVFTIQNGETINVPIEAALGGCLFTDQNKTDLATLMSWYESETYKPPILSASASPNGGTYEKGHTQTVTKITANITKKTSNVVKAEALDGSVVIGTINGTDLTGSQVFANLSIAVSSNKTFSVKITCANGKVTTANTGSFNFVYPYYWGLVAADATVDAAAVTALTKKVESKGTKKPSFTATNQKMVFASPYKITKITDPNGFNVTSTFTENTLKITGLDGTAQTYYVYVANDAATVSAFVMTFTH